MLFYLLQYPKDKEYTTCIDIDKCLEKLKWDDKLAVSANQQHVRNSHLIKISEMYCFPKTESLLNSLFGMRVRQKHEFLLQINSIIQRCVEAGLFQKWEKESYLYPTDAKQREDRLVILTVAHIGGGLLVLICGLILAFLSFMAENYVNRKLRQKNCRLFWILLANFVDGRRFYFRHSIPPKHESNLLMKQHHRRIRIPHRHSI